MKTVTVYQFSELSEPAKKRALSVTRNIVAQEHFWLDEWRETLKRFCSIFPVKWKSFGGGDIRYESLVDPQTNDMRGIRLLKYIVNNYWHEIYKPKYIGYLRGARRPVYSKCQWESCCPLTGYCADDVILEPIIEFLKKPRNNVSLSDILGQCLNNFAWACEQDYESQLEDDYVMDFIEANGYVFKETGEIF